MIEPLAFTLAGGLARLHDGGRLSLIQKIPPNLIYGILILVLWCFLNYPGFDDNVQMTVTGLIALVVWANLQRSYGGWEKWTTAGHFAYLSVAAMILYGLGIGSPTWFAAYVLALLFIGALRPAFSRWWSTVRNWTRYVEFCEGAVVFGGLAAVAV